MDRRGYRRKRIRDPFGRTLEGPPEGVKCHPACRFFICTKKALYYDRRTGRYMCNYVGGECIGGDCVYAKCAIGALLSDGRCRLALTRKAREPEIDEDKLFERFEREFEEDEF